MWRMVSRLYERFGLNAYALGDFERSGKWFSRLERGEGESLRVLRNMGVIAMALGDFPGAERYLTREEELYGECYHRHRALADLYYQIGRREDARVRYRAALAEGEADSLSEGEKLFLAERLAIASDPARFARSREAIAALARGASEKAEGRTDAALALFLEAAEKDPTAWPAMNNAGALLLERSGRAGEALSLFRRAYSAVHLSMIQKNIDLAEQALDREPAGH